jgi:branched-chain amino acid transport system permease protein
MNHILLRRLAAAAIVLVLISLPLWVLPYTLTTAIRILFYSLVGMSLSFLAGQVGMVSLAQTAVFGFSGYVLAILSRHYDVPFPWPEMFGLLGAILLSFVFALIASRTFGVYLLMITLALGQIAWAVATQWVSMTEGFDGIQGVRAPEIAGISFQQPSNFYWLLLAVFLICFFGLRAIIQSPFGLILRGIRENPRRMSALGYSVYWYRVGAFVIAGVLAALAGIAAAQFTGIVTPSSLSLERTVWILLVVILGGVGSLLGTVIGVIIALLFEVVVSQYTDRYLMMMGFAFLLVILFTPNGIVGWFDALQKRRRSLLERR